MRRLIWVFAEHRLHKGFLTLYSTVLYIIPRNAVAKDKNRNTKKRSFCQMGTVKCSPECAYALIDQCQPCCRCSWQYFNSVCGQQNHWSEYAISLAVIVANMISDIQRTLCIFTRSLIVQNVLQPIDCAFNATLYYMVNVQQANNWRNYPCTTYSTTTRMTLLATIEFSIEFS